MHAAVDLQEFGTDDHDGLAAELDAGGADGLDLIDAGDLFEFGVHAGGKMKVAGGERFGGRNEEVGVESVGGPIANGLVTGARDSALSDDESERKHECGNGGGSAARRLNEAVGGERTLMGRSHLSGPRRKRASASEKNGV